MEGFSTSEEIESVRSWAGAGQVDIRSYRGETGKEEPWEAHMLELQEYGVEDKASLMKTE